MTLPRTIKRRKMRQRAKARAIEAAKRLAQMSVSERAAIERMRAMYAKTMQANFDALAQERADLEFYSGDDWPIGTTIRVRPPSRFQQ